MRKKRVIAFLLSLVLLCLTACGGESTDTEEWLMDELKIDGAPQTNTGIQACADDVILMGNTESEDPLRICIDLMDYGTSDSTQDTKALNDFLYQLKETVGLENVVLEIIPSPNIFNGSQEEFEARAEVRTAAIERIETEMMNGGGPDVFLMTYMPYLGLMWLDGSEKYEKTGCLFQYPEKAMEYGYFLPLDEYMEKNTVLTEWDKLTQPVLEAGKNREGQQIIPLSYTFPLLCFPKAEWEHIPDKEYTWNDMISNPKLLPYSLDMANCYSIQFGTDSWPASDYMGYIMGKFADFENEELGFTEEELLTCVNEVLSLEQKDAYGEVPDAQELNASIWLSERTLNKPMTFLPLYNMDGGITAHIKKYAAVNRNTKKAEDAFKVIDLLMSKHFQQWSDLYSQLILVHDVIPLHEELFQKSNPLIGNNYYMREDNYEAFCKVREQITCANFESEGTAMLSSMMQKCFDAWFYEISVEETVHETYQELERRLCE